jgi:magnesium transporter
MGGTVAGVVGSAAYKGGRRIREVDLEADAIETGAERIGAAADAEAGRFVWIGLHEPDEALLRQVQRRFGLHDLAVEDAHSAHQRPKLEVYGDSLFLVLRTAQLRAGKVQCGETHVFAGRGHVVTVRHGPSGSYAEVRRRCEAAPRMLAMGEAFVVYSVMDFVVDNYFPVLHALEGEVDALEEAVFAQRSTRRDVERIYELRHELTTLRRAVAPLQEVCGRMMRFDTPLVGPELHPYFRDVQDHVMRVLEGIDGLRELLTSALEANLLLAALQQSDVMKRLAGWAAILAVPTAVAGVYGMNFEHMPELKEPLAYPAVLLAIVGLCVFLYRRFRRAGWL